MHVLSTFRLNFASVARDGGENKHYLIVSIVAITEIAFLLRVSQSFTSKRLPDDTLRTNMSRAAIVKMFLRHDRNGCSGARDKQVFSVSNMGVLERSTNG